MKHRLTVLSFGGGQDSTAILWRLVFDADFRAEYAPGRLLVVMADTGDEHPDTIAHVWAVMDEMDRLGEEFVLVGPEMGFHSNTWTSLRDHYRRHSIVGSKRFKKSCSDGLKVQPIYKFLDDWVGREYGYESGKKRALKAFVADNGKVDVLIGLARGEEKRLAKTADGGEGLAVWFAECINRRYPLMDRGMDRLDCQAYIRSVGKPVPPPSNCILCPFKSKMELLWTARNLPEDYEEWVGFEAAKLAKFSHLPPEQNVTVFGRKTLPLVLVEAEEEFGHMTDRELERHRWTHGHCVASAY